MGRFLAYIAFLCAIALGAAWWSQGRGGIVAQFSAQRSDHAQTDDRWLDDLYSQNPRDAEAAAAEVTELGEGALPVLRTTLTGSADLDRKKAALKACLLLERRAGPVIPEVAAQLRNPDLTEQAALALSFMGADAFPPLRDALTSQDALLRREAIRSIGKLRARAPLESRVVTPLLIQAMSDFHPSVRAVAATYIGIIHEDPDATVPALMAGLDDPDLDVRRASATALGSFGEAAEPAVPALRKAAGDSDADLAREAGLSLIKLQTAGR